MKFLEFRSITRLDENQAQYKQMLEPMVNNDIIDSAQAQRLINDLRTTLKRQDRIVWYLRWFRIAKTHMAIRTILINPKFEHRKEEFKKLFQRITKVNFNDVDISDANYFDLRWTRPDTLTHVSYLLSIPIVDQLVWDTNFSPSEMGNELGKREREHKARQSQWITPKENDKIILNYGKYAWVMLDRGACSDEADAMGHCGNVPSVEEGERIISFRSIDGEKQKPHLTFILDKHGMLGEMKGRANVKPAPRYHPYIVDLLLQDFIKGIKGGGYLPEENFDIFDLNQEQLSKLISNKPSLVPEIKYEDIHFSTYYKLTIPQEIQQIFIKNDPRWVLRIRNLDPKYKKMRKNMVYAIVTEPGLTWLMHKQYLTKDEYEDSVERFGDDAFEVKFLKNESATAGGTSSGNIASVGSVPAVKRKVGKGKNGLPRARQAKNADGTAKNALDMTTNIFGGPIKR